MSTAVTTSPCALHKGSATVPSPEIEADRSPLMPCAYRVVVIPAGPEDSIHAGLSVSSVYLPVAVVVPLASVVVCADRRPSASGVNVQA